MDIKGGLYLCATPIGNLEDITLRTLETLKNADIIAAEDTRNTLKLLNHFDIKGELTSYHEHNKYDKAEILIRYMYEGKNIALVTDAGTPAISDPGEVLVRRCIEENIPVTSLPGACAAITALTVSGLPTGRFVFEGFLSADKKERQEVLDSLKNETRTAIIYEAPHHLKKTLKLLYDELGERRIALCRELTKLHEEALRMSLSDAVDYYNENEPRGEYVIILEGRSREDILSEEKSTFEDISIKDHVKKYIDAGMDKKEAIKQVSKERMIPKRDVYNEYEREVQ